MQPHRTRAAESGQEFAVQAGGRHAAWSGYAGLGRNGRRPRLARSLGTDHYEVGAESRKRGQVLAAAVHTGRRWPDDAPEARPGTDQSTRRQPGRLRAAAGGATDID